jgi:hypothetical protein
MDVSKPGGPSNSVSTSPALHTPRPSIFSASTLTPSEVEWLRLDSEQARGLFERLAGSDAALTALIEREATSA